MPPSETPSLWSALSAAGDLSDRFLYGPDTTVSFNDLISGSCLGGRAEELRGRSVLVSTRDQITAAATLMELDGIASRLVLCPPGLPVDHLSFVAESASADAIVSDEPTSGLDATGVELFIRCSPKLVPASYDRSAPRQTEWVLLTSGTTGLPKLVAHTLASLSAAIESGEAPSPSIWSTFYDIRRYGGLVIFLRAVLTGASLVLSSAQESTADFLARAASGGVTHVTGTPSHWRRALMSSAAHLISPRYVRLSGEIVDQAILNNLRSFYPNAKIAHAFASTEAGVAFDVNDALTGFPAAFIGKNGDVEIKVEDGSLRIRSNRVADRYLGHETKPLKGADGFVDSGDILELRGDRYYFAGRRDGVINIGGLKVHPEEVEAIVNSHPYVRMSLVRTRKNPITGALVTAEVVLKDEISSVNGKAAQLKEELLGLCRRELPRHKVPSVIRFVTDLPVAATGKILRNHA